MSEEPLVSADEMASVLGSNADGESAPSASPADQDGTPVAYSLRRPLAIAPADEASARARVGRIAETLVEAIQRRLDARLECEDRGFQQQQTSAAVGSLESPVWILAFRSGGGGGMALVMDPACSMSLVELALGGAGTSSAGGRPPTNLERRVMTKLANTLVEPLAARSGIEFASSEFAVGEVPSVVATGGEMVAASILKLKFGGVERGALLLATSSILRKTSESATAPAAAGGGALAGRLKRVAVSIRPVLRAGRVSLQDLRALRPGSVLQLEADENREFDLRIQELGLLRGRISHEEDAMRFAVTWRRPAGSAREVKR